MRTVEVAAALGALSESMKREGYTVREVEDISTVPGLIEGVGKSYLTPLSSPQHNDFTAGNSLWLVAEKGGEPVYLGCARLEDIGSEGIGRYWGRVLRRAYSQGQEDLVIESVRPEVERTLGGKLVYFGDLYVKNQGRGSRKSLRSFVAIGHLAVSLKWNPDWIYCFVRERDVLRGAAVLYGFTSLFPNPFHWLSPPHPRENSEWLAALPRSELWHSVESALGAVKRTGPEGALNQKKGEVQDADPSLVALNG